jgi:hypothetical protein
MMPEPSDFALVPGATGRIGPSPRDRTVAAVCLDAAMRPYLLTARDFRNLKIDDPAAVLAGSDLLEAVPVEWETIAGSDRFEPADLRFGTDDAIYRSRPDGQRIQGVLAALHGLIIIRGGGIGARVSGLLEVRFDASGPSGELPALQPSDLGCLVSLASGQACGVLVAGADRVGYAVPLREALARLQLRLAALPKVVAEVETGLALGLDAIRSEIGRDAELDLGEPPVGLAA